METSKARQRRLREGFFDRYLSGRGIDIGCGDDPVTPECDRWDRRLGHGDATDLAGVAGGAYDWVYSSHLLEHLVEPERALRRWWQVLRPGGHLVLFVPHRDLYEKRRVLPSRFNADHKYFLLPTRDEPPVTFGLAGLLARAVPAGELVRLETCGAGHTIVDPLQHSDGEYSIEAVLLKARGSAADP